ncbi:integrase family protein [Kribbella flavida DSM 17836]|uniref:Integrase family protein n=1 Tax=Kribbella flavida (strain DSM 17836 / JCM 10339 / NBRC 14399) TaxID=479435 RepID=D2PS52_KRIFD|nr:site-specific integrase [Kribbella flavida]ADB31176.1 integrase family protein [Kribbella flavida DSM 17836]
MARPPLPIGTWGKIRTKVTATDDRGRPTKAEAIAKFRDFDGRTRVVQANGRTPNDASNRLRQKLKERSEKARGGELTGLHRFAEAADLWIVKFEGMVESGSRSAGSLDTYRRQLTNHVLPALGQVRLAEATTPLIDKVIAAIKADAGAPTAKTCRSLISGVMGLAVRYGALTANPVREVERIEVGRKKKPRALTAEEIVAWLAKLRADEKAVRKDLPDLSMFMLATGVRIGEALALMWDQVDFAAGQVEITHTVIRVKGQGLLRKPTKSHAGERLLGLPLTTVELLRRRFTVRGRLDMPIFPDSLGGLRDPTNVRRDIRDARGDDALAWITSHSFRKTIATMLDDGEFTAREIADQLGHARPSMTQDVYMGRKLRNPRAASAIDAVLRQALDDQKDG